jgi:hypothetical protein
MKMEKTVNISNMTAKEISHLRDELTKDGWVEDIYSFYNTEELTFRKDEEYGKY